MTLEELCEELRQSLSIPSRSVTNSARAIHERRFISVPGNFTFFVFSSQNSKIVIFAKCRLSQRFYCNMISLIFSGNISSGNGRCFGRTAPSRPSFLSGFGKSHTRAAQQNFVQDCFLQLFCLYDWTAERLLESGLCSPLALWIPAFPAKTCPHVVQKKCIYHSGPPWSV